MYVVVVVVYVVVVYVYVVVVVVAVVVVVVTFVVYGVERPKANPMGQTYKQNTHDRNQRYIRFLQRSELCHVI